MPHPDLLPSAEVARLLGKDVRTIHRMIDRGQLPGTKAHSGLRAPYLIPRRAVEKLMRAAA